MLTRAQALSTWYATLGGWPPTPEQLAGAMQSADAESLAHHLRVFNVPSIQGALPEWIVRDIAPEIGAEQAGLLLVPGFAPPILQGLSEGWTPQRTMSALQATDAYRSMNARQISWAQGNAADRDRATTDEAAKIFNHLRQSYGIDYVNGHGWGMDSEFIRTWATKVASGELAEDQLMFSFTVQAESVAGTPAAAQIVAQRQAIGQIGADVENTAAKMAGAWRDWMGEHRTPPDLSSWASDVVQNVRTMADFETYLRDTSTSFYPNKPQYLSYKDWVQDPKNLIQQMLELPFVKDDDPTLAAFTKGELGTMLDLENKLRADPRHDRTTLSVKANRTAAAGILERMGFA